MGAQRPLLHLLHYELILLRVKIQEKQFPIFRYHQTIWIKEAVILPLSAPVVLIQIHTDLSEPVKQHLLVHPGIITEIIDQQTSFHAVYALPALSSMLDKPQHFIHFIHILFALTMSNPRFPHRRSTPF